MILSKSIQLPSECLNFFNNMSRNSFLLLYLRLYDSLLLLLSGGTLLCSIGSCIMLDSCRYTNEFFTLFFVLICIGSVWSTCIVSDLCGTCMRVSLILQRDSNIVHRINKIINIKHPPVTYSFHIRFFSRKLIWRVTSTFFVTKLYTIKALLFSE